MTSIRCEALPAALPAALANATARLALTIAAARALAVAAVPVAVVNLVTGVVRTIFLNKVLTTGMAALLAAGVIVTGAVVYAFQASRADSASARPAEVVRRAEPAVNYSDNGLLTVTGIVRIRDGSPVAGASVRLVTGLDENVLVLHADDAGRFRLIRQHPSRYE